MVLGITGCIYESPYFGLDPTPPIIVATDPADGGLNVGLTAAISARFSEEIDRATVTEATFTVSGGSGLLAGTIAQSGTAAFFQPDAPLSFMAKYTATITAEVRDLVGNPLSSAHTWSFSTRDLRWDTPVMVSGTAGGATEPDVDVRGQIAAVAWQRLNGSGYDIWAARFVEGTGWSEPQLVDTEDLGSALGPKIAIDPLGSVMVVWQQSDGTRTNIWARRMRADGVWESAETIEAVAGNAHSPRLAVDAEGNVIVVWVQSDGTRDNPFARRFVPGSGWSGISGLQTAGLMGNAKDPAIAIDADGNAIVVWSQDVSGGGAANIWAQRFEPGAGWVDGAILVDSSDEPVALQPSLAFDASGGAVVVWVQGIVGFSGRRVWSSRYFPTSGWEGAQAIEANASEYSRDPRVAVDAEGNTLVVWQHSQSLSDRSDIRTNRLTIGGGWGNDELVEGDDMNSATEPSVVLDARGYGLAVWTMVTEGRWDVWQKRFVPGVGWGAVQLLEEDDLGSNRPSRIRMAPDGTAFSLWQRDDGVTTRIAVSQFQ